jgi:hypothetical protein
VGQPSLEPDDDGQEPGDDGQVAGDDDQAEVGYDGAWLAPDLTADELDDSPGPWLSPEAEWLRTHRGELRARRAALRVQDPARDRRADLVQRVLGLLAVIGATVFVIWQIHPDLIFGSGMDVGGDNGGHVAGPYYLIHNLLPHGRLTGWDPWWFDGTPIYVFYFPLPALMIAVLSAVFPYAVAFKIVTVLGAVTMPVCAWAFGTMAGFRKPVAVLMAAASLPFIFNTSYTIDGGNLTSTLAGEFSFSLAISVGLLFLGVLALSLRTGRWRWLAAVLFAITALCHLVPAMAFAGVAVLMGLTRLKHRGVRVLVPVGVVGGLLAAFWLIPFAADLQYSSSMGYLRIDSSWSGVLHNLVPRGYLFMIVPAGIGFVISIVRREGFAIVLGISALASGAAFTWLPSGLLYNGRWLPFWFLFVTLLAAYGVGESFRLLGSFVMLPRVGAPLGTVIGTFSCLVGATIAGGLIITGIPGWSWRPTGNQIEVQGWATWNYTGFQGKSGWPQFRSMVSMLDAAGAKYGCGRLQYEYIKETTGPFGSTEAMMSVPMWTKGCMEATDGIYFESSTTTPYHFLDQSEVSQDGESPDPISYLTYPGFDLADGVRHLQAMGVRYFLAMSPLVESQAAANPALVKIASSPGITDGNGQINGLAVSHPLMNLYLVKNSPLVTSLHAWPTVEQVSSKQWLDANLAWYEEEQYWAVRLARSGPASWPRAKGGKLIPSQDAEPAPSTSISDVHAGDLSISFHVTRLGTPVLVKIPYFPNWQATGATGPYEVSPNLMVVVPTSHNVRLDYGSTPANWVGKVGSLIGVVGVGALIGLRPVATGSDEPAPSPGDENLGSGEDVEDGHNDGNGNDGDGGEDVEDGHNDGNGDDGDGDANGSDDGGVAEGGSPL